MAKTRGPALNSIKQRALQTLKRKKMYEQQRDSLAAQSFNIEQVSSMMHVRFIFLFILRVLKSMQTTLQARFTIDTAKDSFETVTAMKSATQQIKAEHKKFNFEEMEVSVYLFADKFSVTWYKVDFYFLEYAR